MRTTEAWALADHDALKAAFGTTMSLRDLGLYEAVAHGAESVRAPKDVLQRAFRAARPRSRTGSVTHYLGRMGELSSLDRLRALPAFTQLERVLSAALHAIGLLGVH